MERIKIHTEYIKLDQFLKLAGIADSGVTAKEMVLQGEAMVNGQVEVQRGKKLRPGDKIVVDGAEYLVE